MEENPVGFIIVQRLGWGQTNAGENNEGGWLAPGGEVRFCGNCVSLRIVKAMACPKQENLFTKSTQNFSHIYSV